MHCFTGIPSTPVRLGRQSGLYPSSPTVPGVACIPVPGFAHSGAGAGRAGSTTVPGKPAARYDWRSLAAQNAVVALESLGLGWVYIGGIRNDIEGVANDLGLPPQVYPVFDQCVGYPSPDRPAKPRLPQQGVLHHETYTIAVEEGVLSEYDARLGALYQREGMKASGWPEQVVSRLRSVSTAWARGAAG